MHLIFLHRSIDLRQNVFLKTLLTLVFSCGLLILNPQQSFAQTVQPMIFELEPIGSGSSEYLRIDNPNSGPMTIEIVPLKITLDEFGKESHEAADDDFLIYPPQTIIQGDSTQVVNVRYIGDPTIATSQAYRISVNQLPVDLKAESSGVSLLTKFLTLVNIVPAKSKAKLEVADIKADQDGSWLVTIKNSGNRFGVLSSTSWELESTIDSNRKAKLETDQVSTFVHQTMILPKSVMHFSVPAVEGFDPNSTKITMKREG